MAGAWHGTWSLGVYCVTLVRQGPTRETLTPFKCRPAVEIQIYMANGGALEPEWKQWLGMEERHRTIRFPPGVYLIPRKAAKVFKYTLEVNTTGQATRCNPGMLGVPPMILVAVPAIGAAKEVIEVRTRRFGRVSARQHSCTCINCGATLLQTVLVACR